MHSLIEEKTNNELPRSRADEVSKNGKELLPRCRASRNSLIKFILTGSSARNLRKAGVNLLVGRVLMRHLHQFMAAELKGMFELKKALQVGMIPLVLNSADTLATLQAYVDLYLREEVQIGWAYEEYRELFPVSRNCELFP